MAASAATAGAGAGASTSIYKKMLCVCVCMMDVYFFDDKINPLFYYFYDLFIFKYKKREGEKKFVLVGKNNWARKRNLFYLFKILKRNIKMNFH